MMPADDEENKLQQDGKLTTSSANPSSTSLRMMSGRLGRVRKKKRKGSRKSSSKKTPAAVTSSQIKALLALLLVLVLCIVLEMIVVDSLFMGTKEDEGVNVNGAEAGVDSVVKGSAGVLANASSNKKRKQATSEVEGRDAKNLRGLAAAKESNTTKIKDENEEKEAQAKEDW